jgi:ABC-type transport system substrate-binding protein
VLLLAKDAPQTVIVADAIPDDRAPNLRIGRQNQHTLPWKDPRVRIAIRRSIDFKGIGEFLSNKAEFERNGIEVEVLPTTAVPKDPRYWMNPEKGELGALSANYLYDVAEAKKLMAAAGYTSPVDIQYHVLPASGVVPEQEQLVSDSLAATGTFKVEIMRSLNSVTHRDCRSLGRCDGLVSSGTGNYDADYVIYRDYHSQGNVEGEQAFPDPRLDRVAEGQRKEMDVQKRIEFIKEFQYLAAELMPLIPFVHEYTSFRFRWPWVHNLNYGSGISGRPVLGGHKQWLDAAMPNRERGAS